MKRHRFLLKTLSLGAAIVAGVLSVPAMGGSYDSTSIVYGVAETQDDPYQGQVLWIAYQDANSDTFYASGLRINEHYGLFTAHVFEDFAGSYSNHVIGNGDNYLLNPGQTRTIVDVVIHPTWTATYNGSFLDEIDLAVARFDSDLPGIDAEFSLAVPNEEVTVPDFGIPATPGTGFLPPDGERRAFGVRVEQFGQSNLYSADYIVAVFDPPGFPRPPIPGAPTNGSSNAPLMNQHGEVVGLLSACAGCPNYFSIMASVDLWPHMPWITANAISVLDCPGDADGSRVVDVRDFAILQQTFGQSDAAFSHGDFDHDDDVDFDDITILVDEMGTVCPAP